MLENKVGSYIIYSKLVPYFSAIYDNNKGLYPTNESKDMVS